MMHQFPQATVNLIVHDGFLSREILTFFGMVYLSTPASLLIKLKLSHGEQPTLRNSLIMVLLEA